MPRFLSEEETPYQQPASQQQIENTAALFLAGTLTQPPGRDNGGLPGRPVGDDGESPVRPVVPPLNSGAIRRGRPGVFVPPLDLGFIRRNSQSQQDSHVTRDRFNTPSDSGASPETPCTSSVRRNTLQNEIRQNPSQQRQGPGFLRGTRKRTREEMEKDAFGRALEKDRQCWVLRTEKNGNITRGGVTNETVHRTVSAHIV